MIIRSQIRRSHLLERSENRRGRTIVQRVVVLNFRALQLRRIAALQGLYYA